MKRTTRSRRIVVLILLSWASLGAGCAGTSNGWGGPRWWSGRERYEIDVGLAAQARSSLNDPDFSEFDDKPERWEQPEDRRSNRGSVGEMILGEVIAIFPGAIVPGLGHYYAGDHRTSSQLRRVGGLGLALSIVGGGLVTGGYFLDEEEDVPDGYAYGLYGTGGTVGAIGLTYYLTAWIYDIIDTPRAVRTGGRPPPRSEFVESLDFLGSG